MAERDALKALRAYDSGGASLQACLDSLGVYETIRQTKKSYLVDYAHTLEAAPWRVCRCRLCVEHGIEIAIFRGTERNKRRGFHNMSVLADRMSTLNIVPRRIDV